MLGAGDTLRGIDGQRPAVGETHWSAAVTQLVPGDKGLSALVIARNHAGLHYLADFEDVAVAGQNFPRPGVNAIEDPDSITDSQSKLGLFTAYLCRNDDPILAELANLAEPPADGTPDRIHVGIRWHRNAQPESRLTAAGFHSLPPEPGDAFD